MCERHELRRTLAPLRQGGGDLTGRHTPDGSVWRATRTPAGPATGRYRPVPRTATVEVEAWGPGAGWLVEHAPDLLGVHDRIDGWPATRTPAGPATGRYRPVPRTATVEVEAWGPGAGWLVEHAPDLLGVHDRIDGWPDLAAGHPVLARLARDHPGFRLGRSLAVFETLVPTILAQKVTGREAKRSWRAVLRRWGEPAPGPVPLVLPPAPEVLAGVGYYELHPLGVERTRAETIRSVARQAGPLEVLAGRSRTEAEQRLRAILGIGAWTAAEVGLIALGNADAVSVGDYHIPKVICFALTGERGGTDERMLELLAPFAPHRGRAIRLIESARLGPERRGPRLVPIDNRRR